MESLFKDVGDNFFVDQDGANLSEFQKNVTGTDQTLVDTAQVGAQVVGVQLHKWGGGQSGMWDAQQKVKEIKADGRKHPGALATMNNNLFGPTRRGYGTMTLYKGAFDGRADRSSSSRLL